MQMSASPVKVFSSIYSKWYHVQYEPSASTSHTNTTWKPSLTASLIRGSINVASPQDFSLYQPLIAAL